jgi:hypothetical protein
MEANKDISHTIACEVLHVPTCVDGWLVLPDSNADPENRNAVTIQQNKKSGKPGLSSKQLDDMEFLLRLRDCTYQQSLRRHKDNNNFIIHDGSGGDDNNSNKFWDDCSVTSSSLPLWNESSTDDILEILKDQVSCGSGRLSTDMIHQRRRRQQQSLLSATAVVERQTRSNNNHPQIIAGTTISARHGTLYETAKIQSALLVMFSVVLVVYIFPKTIWWKKSIRRGR